jgi:DNA-binding NtrC family response regulator
MKPTILIVDDEPGVREAFRLALQDLYQITITEDVRSTFSVLKSKTFDICLLDVILPDGSGIDLLQQIKTKKNQLEVVMITALQSMDVALEAMKLGAYDYITKPFQLEDLYQIICRILKKKTLERENQYLKDEVYKNQSTLRLSSNNSSPIRTFPDISKLALLDTSILISGEVGSHKKWIAQKIHEMSGRKEFPFITLDCCDLNDGENDIEIFGEEQTFENLESHLQIGKLEFADGGTLFLNQVDRLSLGYQTKLFRALMEKQIFRIGSEIPVRFDLRIIASTSVDIGNLVAQHRFAKEFYRLIRDTELKVIPLRERKEDIPILINEFIRLANVKSKIHVKSISEEAVNILMCYDWPGNCAELEAVIELMVISSQSEYLSVEDLPLDILIHQINHAQTEGEARLSLKRIRNQFERQYIRKILEQTKGNQTRAAKILGLHRNTLIWKLNMLNLVDDYKNIVQIRRNSKYNLGD